MGQGFSASEHHVPDRVLLTMMLTLPGSWGRMMFSMNIASVTH